MNNEERRNSPMKKFAAVLAALLVLSCGTTVLAAPSANASALKDAVSTKTEGVTLDKVEDKVVTDAFKVAEEKDAKSEVLALVDVKATVNGSKTITFEVKGVNAGDKIYLLHQKNDGKWEVIHPDKVEKDSVTATFKSLSPVAIVKVPATSTLPKTGAPVVLPVVALICAAGAAGCAKKVKFN